MTKANNKYLKLKKHYEDCLERYGDTHLGVDWPNQEDALKRYSIMSQVIREEDRNTKQTLLDFGCGASHFLEFLIKSNAYSNVEYAGLDISPDFINLSKNKYPFIEYYCMDFLEHRIQLPIFDYIIMNGIFTEKRSLTFDEMFSFFKSIILKAFQFTSKGLAFNVMSKNVDWERDDLFHLSLDVLTEFLCKNVTRNYVIRNDYGLYEYTVYIYKDIERL